MSDGRITWQSFARLIALASWILAIALTGGMGWQAWTAIQDTAGTPRYGSAQVNTAMIEQQAAIDAELMGRKKWVAR